MSDDLIITCACGYEAWGIPDKLIPRVRQHLREEHHMDLTEEQVRAMARPVDAPGR